MNKFEKVKIIAKDKDHLKKLIAQEMKQHGNECDLNHIDTSHIRTMSYLFDGSNFNGDISQWDVSNVTNMGAMFAKSLFNNNISTWNMSNVENVAFMFYEANFNGNISQWDVSNINDMKCMFWDSKFNGCISQWNVENVKNMDGMFYRTPFLGNIDNWKPYSLESSNDILDKVKPNVPYWLGCISKEQITILINNYVEKKKLYNDLNEKCSNNENTNESNLIATKKSKI